MQNDLFEKKAIPEAYLRLALPVVFSMVVSLVYNMVDTYYIAHTGNTNLVAGISIAAPVFTFMIAIGDIFGLGGSSVISRLLGKRAYADSKRLSVFCFYGALLAGVLIAAIMLLFHIPILQLLGADTQTEPYAWQYYKYLALGAPFIIVSYTPSNLLRTEGFATASMCGTILGAVINIILDPILIFKLQMGAAGAAIATVIGNICTDVFFVWFLLKKSERLSISLKLLQIKTVELAAVFAIGIPASITNLMQSIGVAMINRFLLPYGNSAVAAMGIAMKINMIAVLILVGFAFGGQPLIGFNYGAGHTERLKKTIRFAYLSEGSIALLLTLALWMAAPGLFRMFATDGDIISMGTEMLRAQLFSMVFVGIVLITTCIFQSTGIAVGALVLSLCRQGIVLAVVLTVASKLAAYKGVILSQALSDLGTSIIALFLLATFMGKSLRKIKNVA